MLRLWALCCGNPVYRLSGVLWGPLSLRAGTRLVPRLPTHTAAAQLYHSIYRMNLQPTGYFYTFSDINLVYERRY